MTNGAPRVQSHVRCQAHFAPTFMHSRSPVEPSLQTTPISIFGPQPSASGQGVVLGGGTHVERQTHSPSFSLPQTAPPNVVPLVQTLASGLAPHSFSSH